MTLVDFGDWVIKYPAPWEEGFDGIHYGGIKGIKEGAPEEIKEAFKEYTENLKKGMK